MPTAVTPPFKASLALKEDGSIDVEVPKFNFDVPIDIGGLRPGCAKCSAVLRSTAATCATYALACAASAFVASPFATGSGRARLADLEA